jgi:hypothetical protein
MPLLFDQLILEHENDPVIYFLLRGLKFMKGKYYIACFYSFSEIFTVAEGLRHSRFEFPRVFLSQRSAPSCAKVFVDRLSSAWEINVDLRCLTTNLTLDLDLSLSALISPINHGFLLDYLYNR